MPYDVWQNMPKAQDDAETIEEAIDRKITAHNDDVDAHLGDNQSLKSHRASEIIDHLATSIVQDKFSDALFGRKLVLADTGDPDKWLSNGTTLFYIDGLYISSAASETVLRYVYQDSLNWMSNFIDRLPCISCEFNIEAAGNYEGFFGFGDPDFQMDGFSIGFFFLNGAVYCEYIEDLNNVTPTNEITGVSASASHVYKIDVISRTEINFYIDNELVFTIDSIPSYFNDAFHFAFTLFTKNSSNFSRAFITPFQLYFNT